jgi:hypothetical protein
MSVLSTVSCSSKSYGILLSAWLGAEALHSIAQLAESKKKAFLNVWCTNEESNQDGVRRWGCQMTLCMSYWIQRERERERERDVSKPGFIPRKKQEYKWAISLCHPTNSDILNKAVILGLPRGHLSEKSWEYDTCCLLSIGNVAGYYHYDWCYWTQR